MNRRTTLAPGLTAAALAGVLCVWCTTKAPTEAEDTTAAIELSVGRKGTTEAFFTGTPLAMIVELADTLRYVPDAVSFDKGEATFLLPDTPEGTMVTELEYRFFWTVTPRGGFDTATGFFFDTVSARIGLEHSNVVKVLVKNLPPEIRSLVVGDTSVAVSEHVYGDRIYTFHVDSVVHPDSARLHLELVARDSDPEDANRLTATWQPRVNEDLLFVQSGPPIRGLKATYHLPETNFLDTIQVTLQDRHTHVVTQVVLYRTGGKKPAHIDSMVVGDTTFVDAGGDLVYRVPAADTTKLRLFTAAERVTAQWTARRGTVGAVSDEEAPFAAVHACTSGNCLDTLRRDTTVVLDTVTVKLTTAGGESNTARVIFVKVPVNRRPEIDSLQVDSSTLLAAVEGRPYEYRAAVGDTLHLRGFYHDVEDRVDELAADWRSSRAGRIVEKPRQDVAVYVCAGAAYLDTLTFEVEDQLGFKSSKSILLTVTLRPTIDSITIGDEVYRDMGKAIAYEASLGDTVVVACYAHAPADGEIVTTFGCASEARTQSEGLNALRYFARTDTLYSDTCSILVKDLAGVATGKAVYLDFVNYRPSIDSIVIDSLRHVPGASAVGVSATVGDTLALRVYAADPDSGELTDAWTVSDTTHRGRLDRLGAFHVQYRCLDELSADTLFAGVTDAFGAAASVAIIISVDNRIPRLDSLSVGDSVYAWDGRNPVVHTHRAPADSLLSLMDYAHDPDVGDVVSVTYRFPATGRTQTKAAGVGYSYTPLADSAYIDTAVVSVRDQRGASETRRVILEFEKP